jgi:hypothetical protein
MGNGDSSSSKFMTLLVGIIIGIAIGLGAAMCYEGDGDDGARGEWHDSPSPQTSPERIVNMNLMEIQGLNGASNATQNPQKPAIELLLTQLMDPNFTPADRVGAAIRIHNAWKFATKGVWASVHEELTGIN